MHCQTSQPLTAPSTPLKLHHDINIISPPPARIIRAAEVPFSLRHPLLRQSRRVRSTQIRHARSLQRTALALHWTPRPYVACPCGHARLLRAIGQRLSPERGLRMRVHAEVAPAFVKRRTGTTGWLAVRESGCGSERRREIGRCADCRGADVRGGQDPRRIPVKVL